MRSSTSRRNLFLVALAILTGGSLLGQGGGPRSVSFKYRNQTGRMDDYPTLFSGSVGKDGRRKLFEAYVANSKEGRARASTVPGRIAQQVWSGKMTIEEQTTFLAITGALAEVTDQSGASLLSWIDSLEEIHGEAKYPAGPRFSNDEAFRLYVRLRPAAIAQLSTGKTTFVNACDHKGYTYGKKGFTHPDFCLPPGDFQATRKTDNQPNIQFNFTNSTCCADIDIDYDEGLQHFRRDNSNVLPRNHTANGFVPVYCDPGFDTK